MIRVVNLSKSFSAIKAVINANLEVDEGEIFGLVGPDGAGKTTLLRMICGLITPDDGEVLITGRPGSKAQPPHRDEIGYMPQKFSLYGDLTVMENINFFASMYNLDRNTIAERAEEILSITNLLTFKHRLADHLSGGMKQKLALTCALITRPLLLILDEPTYGVDPLSRKDFWKIIYGLNQSGMTVLVSTAYMDEAELCTRVAFINEGMIKAINSPVGFRSSFRSHILEVRTISRDPYLFNDIPGLLDVSFYGYKYQIITNSLEETSAAIASYLDQNKLPLLSLTEVSLSMEDVFVLLAEKEVGGWNMR